MKRISLLLALLTTTILLGQSKSIDLGIATGFLHRTAYSTINDTKDSATEIEWYAGLSLGIELAEKDDLQIQALYGVSDISDRLFLPILYKRNLGSNFSFLVGPQFLFELEEVPNDFNSVNFGGMFGLSYDVDDNFSIQTTYFIQANNSYNGDLDIELRDNYFNLGFIFRFL